MINIERLRRDIEDLSEIGRVQSGGVCRASFSDADLQARKWFVDRLEKAGLTVETDPAGNIFGGLKGRGPTIICGSHLDTIENGGFYDGSLGVLSALECVRVIKERGLETKSPIEVVSFVDEEERFVGFLGSYALTGKIEAEEIYDKRDSKGYRLRDAMAKLGLDIQNISKAKRNPEEIKAFVELHIEQGPVLESMGIPIGVVDVMKGNYRYGVNIQGRTDHAGVPMSGRRDALIGALTMIQKELEFVRQTGGRETLITVGDVRVDPGLSNVIPGHAFFTIDFRDVRIGLLKRLEKHLAKMAREISVERNLKITIEPILKIDPVRLSKELQNTIKQVTEDLNLKWHRMASGAGHDAQVLGMVVPTAMIFVPSYQGRSHCPEEYTDWKDIENGANVLLGTILHLANT